MKHFAYVLMIGLLNFFCQLYFLSYNYKITMVHMLLIVGHFVGRFVLAFSLGAGPVPGLLLPEIFPNKIRAKAMALCMSVHWVRVLSFQHEETIGSS
jgi:hypothetical protein